jgi:hypothetical protein
VAVVHHTLQVLHYIHTCQWHTLHLKVGHQAGHTPKTSSWLDTNGCASCSQAFL